jgi:peptidylprolyl isomerase
MSLPKTSRLRDSLRLLARPVTALLSVGATVFAAACGDATGVSGKPSDPATEAYASSLGVTIASMTKKNTSLYYQDIVVGTGAEAVNGRSLSVVYSGYLVNGSKFDSNVGGNLFAFVLGSGQVITGWDLGVVGMKVGGKRRLVIGSTYGYGSSGTGPIPANATLVFDVELKALQ